MQHLSLDFEIQVRQKRPSIVRFSEYWSWYFHLQYGEDWLRCFCKKKTIKSLNEIQVFLLLFIGMYIVLDWSPLSLAPLTMTHNLSSRGEAVAIQIEVKKGFIFSWIASLSLAMTGWRLKPLSLAPCSTAPLAGSENSLSVRKDSSQWWSWFQVAFRMKMRKL